MRLYNKASENVPPIFSYIIVVVVLEKTAGMKYDTAGPLYIFRHFLTLFSSQ